MEEINDFVYLALIRYLREKYPEKLFKWAFGGSTTMHRLTTIKNSIENGEALKETEKGYLQRVLSHCEKRKIREWMKIPEFPQYYKLAKEKLEAKQESQEIFETLKNKIMPVKFKHFNQYGDAIGWISCQKNDKTIPTELQKKLFILPKKFIPAGFQTGFIYKTSIIDVTNGGGAIKVKIA